MEERVRFYKDVRQRLTEIPEVTAASVSTSMPGTGSGGTAFALQGVAYAEDRDYPTARRVIVSPGYFETFGVSLSQGRDFNTGDVADGVPVAIVNQSFAARHGAGDPLGMQVRLGRSESEEPWLTIVGVVPDLYMEGIGNTEGDPAGLYTPLAQGDARFMSLAARGPAEPMSLTATVRDAVASVDPDIPIYWADTLAGRLSQQTWFYNVFGVLFMIFGASALFLAAVGLYGVMSFSVVQRLREIGIRMALGARGGDVVRMVSRQGLTLALVGIGIGLVAVGHERAVVDLVTHGIAVIVGIAGISETVRAVGVRLVGVGVQRAVVITVVDAVIVVVQIAGVSERVSIRVDLVRIGQQRAVVRVVDHAVVVVVVIAYVALAVRVVVRLVRIRHLRAVVAAVLEAVVVLVLRDVAGVADAVPVTITLRGVEDVRAVVVLVDDSVSVGVC